MLSPFYEINYLAVIISTIVYFILGAVWYSAAVFGKDWMSLANVKFNEGQSNLKLYLSTFAAILITVIILAYIVVSTDTNTFAGGMRIGFLTALGFMAMPLGVTFLYEGKETKLFLIDAGYHFFGILLSGTILALWR
jgi:hypothetical protein